jgi:hypothetical protein
MNMVQAKVLLTLLVGFTFSQGGGTQPISRAPAPNLAQAQSSRLIALRIVGSNVRNPQGEYLGRIEQAAVNPATGQIEFAMLQTRYPTLSSRVTPVPWKVLGYVSDQSQTGGPPGAVQTFNLNMSRAQIERAPTIDKLQWPNLNEPYWLQRIFAYYGVTPGPEPAPLGAGPAAAGAPASAAAPAFYAPGDFATVGGAAATTVGDTNEPTSLSNAPPFVAIPAGATNPIFNTNIFVNRTNFFLNQTNFFPGTTTPFNSDNPNTFPTAGPATNLNPFVVTNTRSGTVVASNSPYAPRFLVASNLPALGPPQAGNFPWSPQFSSQGTGPQLPIASQPNPWGPRFASPTVSDQQFPQGSQPNAWAPRFQNPNLASGAASGSAQSSAGALGTVSSQAGAQASPAATSPGSAWAPAFGDAASASASASAPATTSGATPAAAPVTRAPVQRAIPVRRR